MMRFLLATAVIGFVAAAAVYSVEVPTDKAVDNPTQAKACPVYVKILWPVDPATAPKKEGSVVESWIAKSLPAQPQVHYAVAADWVLLGEKSNGVKDFKHDTTTRVWDGQLGGKTLVCGVTADGVERKEGRVKIVLTDWGPISREVTLTLVDEPGSRDVRRAIEVETVLGSPYVAVLIGPPAK